MSLQQTAYSLPNFSVRPSRDQRAPYDTIHNLPAILNVTSYDDLTLPVTFVQAGSLLVKPASAISIALPADLSLFRYLGGFKYISNGDTHKITIINKGSAAATFTHGQESQTFAFGNCGCLVIEWTTEDEAGNPLPIEDVTYEIL
jgi:hypothetical protein